MKASLVYYEVVGLNVNQGPLVAVCELIFHLLTVSFQLFVLLMLWLKNRWEGWRVNNEGKFDHLNPLFYPPDVGFSSDDIFLPYLLFTW